MRSKSMVIFIPFGVYPPEMVVIVREFGGVMETQHVFLCFGTPINCLILHLLFVRSRRTLWWYICFCKLRKYEKTYRFFIKYQNHSKPTKHRWIFNLPWIPTGIGLPSAAKIRCHSRPKESGKESRGTLAKLGNMPRVVSPRHFTGNWALAAGCGW